MSVSQQERVTSLYPEPATAVELIAAVEGAHSGVPCSELPTDHYMRVDGGPTAGFERAQGEDSEHALLGLVVSPSGGVFSVNRVTLHDETSGGWTGLTVNDLSEEKDGVTVARTRGFLDTRGDFQPVVVDEGLELLYAPGAGDGSDAFIVVNTSGQTVRVAHSNGQRPNNGAGYFGGCWADTRTGDRGLATLQKGEFLPGQANAEVTARRQAGRYDAQDSPMVTDPEEPSHTTPGGVILQGEVISDVVFIHPDGTWAQRRFDTPGDVEKWGVEQTDYAVRSGRRTAEQMERWFSANREQGRHWLRDNVEKGEAFAEALKSAPPGETVGLHRNTSDGGNGPNDGREGNGMFLADTGRAQAMYHYRGRHARDSRELLGQAS